MTILRFVTVLLLTTSSGFVWRVAADQPNIVVILADDLGYGDPHCFNAESKIATPRLDRLASEGVRFTDAHTASSVCTPTRYGLLTGRYPWRTHLQNGVLMGYSPPLIAANRMTVASLLKSRGYTTACVGKWHLGVDWATNNAPPAPETGKNTPPVDWSKPVGHGPVQLGFDYFFGVSASMDMPPFVFIENDRLTATPTTEKKWGRSGAAAAEFEAEAGLPTLVEKATAWIRKQAAGSKPFFLYLPLTSPHTPILPTKEWQGKSGLNAYADFVMQTDAAAGAVLDALEASGVTKNTLVIFTSDNGCSPAAGTGQLLAKGHKPSGPWRGLKSDIWEGGHRVPFIARWPSQIKAGTKSEETICLNDLLATCAAIVGAKVPDEAGEDSVSFLPALRGENNRKPLREATVHHSIEGKFAIRQGPWKLALCPGSGGWSAPKDPAALKDGAPAVQLYNLAKDPAETTNVQADAPEVVARLTKLLEKYVAEGRSTPGKSQANDGPVDMWKKPRPAVEKSKPVSDASGPAASQPLPPERFVYKKVADRELALTVIRPAAWKPADKRPAALFFHGGSWTGGTPKQFQTQAEYLATRGMVCALVEYRLAPPKSDIPPTNCVQDAKSAMRWARAHAAELGIDPRRIAAGGGSAGGHLAAFTGLVAGLDDPQDDLKISARPDALLLFNPVFNNGPGQWGHNRVGERYREFSPAHNISAGAPPTVILIGSADRLIGPAVVEEFKAGMEKAGVRCDVHFYRDQPHSFFNKEPYRSATLFEADKFLASLGWLKGEPTFPMPDL